MPLNLSGNLATEFADATQKRQDFAVDGPYRMYQLHLSAGEQTEITPTLTAYSIFVLSGEVTAGDYVLGPHDGMNVINQDYVVSCTENAQVIIAGVTDTIDVPPQVIFVAATNQYRVDKPWGHELWISGHDNPYYSLKEVFIRQGNRTSLQYHNFKYEANVIFNGTARLFYQKNMDVALDDLTAEDLATHDVHGLSGINISPRVIHRLFAVTDVMIYEASTPHLDDVVRVSDDSGRQSGRIQAEHQAASV
jgi:mannose-6-phosphate isomerase